MTYREAVTFPHGRPTRRALLLGGASLGAGAGLLAGAPSGAAAPARRIALARFDDPADWARGTAAGTGVVRGRLALTAPAAARTVGGVRYELGSWESPWVSPGFGLTQLIPSWNARTPGGSFLEVRVRGRDATGRTSSWDLMARWAAGDAVHRRRSYAGQDDDLGRVDVDTWSASSPVSAYQLRITLARRAGGTDAPTVTSLHAVASALPAGTPPTSAPGVAAAAGGVVLDVPRYSQMVHEGDYPQWDGGGEAWCSPTSVSMVLGHLGRLPSRAAYAWVRPGHVDPWVDHAARMTYDHDYDGCGNWAFSTAYGANLAGRGFVTRLRSLRDAERFLAAGIPLVASIAFGPGGLDGSPLTSTRGHLLVIAGFTATGDVVVNDPASRTRAGVRRTYDRAQFENVWLPTSGGLVYVLHRADQPLPTGARGAW